MVDRAAFKPRGWPVAGLASLLAEEAGTQIKALLDLQQIQAKPTYIQDTSPKKFGTLSHFPHYIKSIGRAP